MDKILLKKHPHGFKTGGKSPELNPNILDSCLLIENGEVVGFFLKNLPNKISKLANLCDTELRSKRVPKSVMKRSSGFTDPSNEVLQYSTIIGSIPPKPHMRRPYPSLSSVHQVKTAQNFIKGMLLLAKESEKIIQEYMPKQYGYIKNLFDNEVDPKWKIGNIFTSSISNFNINADFHVDNGNIPNSLNVIITKRKGSEGNNLVVPDYDAVFDQSDNSMLVYPAWRNMHAVTPIKNYAKGGYRNSLVFYPLKAFINK